jgi:hypothetical protein
MGVDVFMLLRTGKFISGDRARSLTGKKLIASVACPRKKKRGSRLGERGNDRCHLESTWGESRNGIRN